MGKTKQNFQATGIVPKESEVQRAYFDWLRTVPLPGHPGRTLWDVSFAVPNGALLAGNAQQRAYRMAYMKAQGLKPGVSDIVIALRVGQWAGAYIELKRDTKAKISDDQKAWLDLVKTTGYYSAIAPGLDSAIQHTKAFLEG